MVGGSWLYSLLVGSEVNGEQRPLHVYVYNVYNLYIKARVSVCVCTRLKSPSPRTSETSQSGWSFEQLGSFSSSRDTIIAELKFTGQPYI